MTPADQRRTIGRIVRSLRERAGHSPAGFAKACNTSPVHLRGIETGHKYIGAGLLLALERELGTHGLLTELVRSGGNAMHRRTILQSLALMGASVEDKARSGTVTHLDAIRSMTVSLRGLDNIHGGVHSHHAVAAYLHSVALPALKQSPARIGGDARGAVAELILLTGWTAYDAGEHAVAVTHFEQARALAADAGDLALVGETLAAMSHQAAFLGRGSDAVDHADAALAAAVRAGMPSLAAEAHMSAAHGAALRGESRTAAVLLGRAERDLDRADRDSAPGWSTFLSGSYLAARAGHSLLAAGDYTGAVAQARASLDMEPGYDRGRMFNLALLTTALVRAGQPEEAYATGQKTLAVAETISSARADEYLRRIALTLVPYRTEPGAGDLMSRIGERLLPIEEEGLEADH
jgi:transcriptional regulator with XRE-family HTH domain